MAITFQNEKLNKNRELVDKIKDGLAYADAVVAETESHSAYFGNLPEGLTKEVVTDVHKYNDKFIAASHVALGEMTAEAFVKNKDVDRVVGKVGFFGPKDSIETVTDRNKTYPNSFAKEGEPNTIEKDFVMKSTVTTGGYGLKGVMRMMAEDYAANHKK